MNNELYKKLVDLYAGDELSEELKEELETAAFGDPDLSHEMMSLRTTLRTLKQLPEPEFTQESFHRILLKMYGKGMEVTPLSPEPSHLQLRLPLSG